MSRAWAIMLAGLWMLLTRQAAAEFPAVPAGADGADVAVQRGVQFLLTQQQADGSVCDAGLRGRYSSALTGLSLLALVAAGHDLSDHSPEAFALRRAVDFLLRADRQDREGYFGRADGSLMYGQGIVTLALAEMLQLRLDPEKAGNARIRLQLAANQIIRAQGARKFHPEYVGGWRYQPADVESDVSVTVWQLLALRSAEKSGVPVPRAVADGVQDFLEYSFNQNNGHFAYSPFDVWNFGTRHFDWTPRSSPIAVAVPT